MNIERLPEPLDALVIKDTYEIITLSNVRDEARNLMRKDDGTGVWLSDIYKDMEMSPIGRNVVDTLFSEEVVDTLVGMNSLYGMYTHINNHSTIVRYYGHMQESIVREDAAAFTAMTFLRNTTNDFEGGELIIQLGGDIAYEQPIENNMTVIFPSSYYVGITQVKSLDHSIDDAGLYVISNYLFIESS
jgi:hypothetical protein